MASNVKVLDPVEGLVEYVLDIKPYHTKIMEVLIEYVYNEPVDIIFTENKHFKIDLFQPTSSELLLYCEGGYAGRSYGDPQTYPIISPNQAIDFETYPAINGGNNSFTTPGNRVPDIKPDNQIYIATFVETFIDSVTESPATISLLGDYTSSYLTGDVFEVIDSYELDKFYSVTSNATFDGTHTNILVDQSITITETNVKLGLTKLSSNNTGIFTVLSVVYHPGFIDSWPDIVDASSYILGDDPHTIITTQETLFDVPILGSNQIYVASVQSDPLVVEGSLFYSNYLEVYDPNGPTWISTPDEGFSRYDIIGVTPSTIDGSGFPISDSGKFIISGSVDQSNIFVGNVLKISSSSGNNGIYTITSIVYDGGADETTFGVEDLVDSSLADGVMTIDIPSNVFIIDGNYVTKFTQGTQFNIVGGNKYGIYTTLTSDYVNGKTRIRVTSDIFNTDIGYSIIGTTGGFVIHGDRTLTFLANSQFNIIGSSHNDGSYVVSASGPVYNSGTGETTIPVDVTINSAIGGRMQPYITGVIKGVGYGFSESSTLCGTVPDTMVYVYLGERLKFEGLGLALSDDLIVYNMENNDTHGFDMPISTILSDTQPPIPEQLTAPVSPSRGDLWFDTSVDIFKQFEGIWKEITTAWWFDTANELLYYITKNNLVDTGWILDFQSTSSGVPGFDQSTPASSEMEFLDEQVYTIADLGGGVPQDTFILDTAVPNSDASLLQVNVNGIPTAFTLNTSTEFTIASGSSEIGDFVKATIYDRTGTLTNTAVIPWSLEQHKVFHNYITVDTVNDAYIVSGGNWIDRFNLTNIFNVVSSDEFGTNSITQTSTVRHFNIVDVDVDTQEIVVDGSIDWLFTTGVSFNVQLSDSNYKSFTVASDSQPPVGGLTTITVVSDLDEQTMYNPGVTIHNIDNVTDTIIVYGNVVDVYTVSSTILVENSTTGNNGLWIVDSVNYDGINNRTNIVVTGDLPDPDASTNATLRTEIFQNFSRDLGIVIGVVFDPNTSGVGIYDTDQPKTIVATTSTVNPDAIGISYQWLGPVRFDIGLQPTTITDFTIPDLLGIADELLAFPTNYNILRTDRVEDYFVISYVDPTTSLPVDLTDSFTSRTIFDVIGSFSNNTPTTIETNDAKYVVSQSYFDDPDNYFVALGGETKIVWNNLYIANQIYKNGVLLVEGTDYAITGVNETCFADPTDCPGIGIALVTSDVIIQMPVGIPVSWATGSGETFIQIDTEYDNIPPYNNFTVVGVSNNGASLGTLTLSGNHETLFNIFASGIFRLDVPLVSNDQVYNVITVTNVFYDGANTILTVQEEFIDEAYTGDLGIIETVYSGDIFYDSGNVTLPWVDGTINRTSIKIDQADPNSAATAIDDQLIFGWGTVVQYDIVVTDNTANFETIDIDGNPVTPDVNLYRGSISIDGDKTAAIELNDRFSIRGSDGNDGEYEAALISYNVGNDDTDITPRNMPRSYEITTVADIAGNLNNKYFLLSTPSEQYYVWLNVAFTGTDPSVGTKTGIEVDIHLTGSADTIAYNIMDELNKTGVFSASVNANLISVDVISSGEPQTYAYDVDTNFTINNYTLPNQPAANQQGLFELENVDITNWFQYLIQQMKPTTNEIIINGNALGDVQNGVQLRVVGTNNNDSIFTVSSSPTYDTSNAVTVTSVTESISYGTNEIVELLSSTQIKTLGNCANFLDGEDVINVANSTGNDGAYIIQGVEYVNPYSLLTISPSLPDGTPDGDVEYVDRGGWAESVRHQGIHIFYRDTVGITASEIVDAVVLTTGLSIMDSWDAPYWDIGSFDESLETVIHLYSNTF